jgi:hypothetical protein
MTTRLEEIRDLIADGIPEGAVSMVVEKIVLKDGGEREAKTVHFEWLNEVVKATNVKIDQFLWR